MNLVDELSEVEAEDARRVISTRRAGEERTTLILDDTEARRVCAASSDIAREPAARDRALRSPAPPRPRVRLRSAIT
ncbi:MAG TPA: hypothetical protein VNS09_20450 [Solirubrobacter sp.]|nr:hypothetical protein [Solirubrobacter sp.]